MMKKKLFTIILAISLIIIATSGCIRIELNKREDDDSKSNQVIVTEIIDGDTIKVKYDNDTTETVRIIGIDTPETHTSPDVGEWEEIDLDLANETLLENYGH